MGLAGLREVVESAANRLLTRSPTGSAPGYDDHGLTETNHRSRRERWERTSRVCRHEERRPRGCQDEPSRCSPSCHVASTSRPATSSSAGTFNVSWGTSRSMIPDWSTGSIRNSRFRWVIVIDFPDSESSANTPYSFLRNSVAVILDLRSNIVNERTLVYAISVRKSV